MTTTIRAFASSRLINPAGATPVLTVEQVWAGLGIKAKKPQSFVAAISSCEVVSEVGNKIERKVRFGDGPVATEQIESHDQSIVYFEHSSDYRIINLISYNESGEALLTYSFANGIPGFDATGLSVEELNKRIGGGVDASIARIRELVRDGTIA